MKKILYLMLILVTALVTVSCSKEEDNTIHFEKERYAITTGTLKVRLVVPSGQTNGQEIPVTFSGEAIKGSDYTVSSEKYIADGNAENLTISISAKNNFSTPKVIIMNAGDAKTTILLGKRDAMLYSFESASYVLAQEVEVRVGILNARTGEYMSAPNDVEVKMGVADTSTAVEGTNFEFVNKSAVIKKGSNYCTFKLKKLNYEKDKDLIVLKPLVTEEEGFIEGQYPTTEVKMIEGYAYDLMGTWVMNEMVTTPESLSTLWGYLMDSDTENLPRFDANDTFTFESGAYSGFQLTTDLSSSLKDYFHSSSEFTFDKDYNIHVGMQQVTLQLLLMKNVNRFFSPTEKSEDKEAYLGVRNIVDESTGEVLLDVYIIDHNSKSFLQSVSDYAYMPYKPTADNIYSYINFTLKKKK
ncbi:MAG: hypothetical protein E7104_07290 [Prevotella sp.]|nr:hypothetical protein [Prevotella sp.]